MRRVKWTKKTKLSRRSFLKTGLAGAAAAATAVSFPAIAAETKERASAA
ncbi:MAG: twin-arginine translocation signal domain-containing protein [Geovibrio sp.]|nr:twin-arginine translocation signal domain-containing protein [Geovibrio sp.]